MSVVIGVDPHKQTHTAVAVRTGSAEAVGELTAAARAAGHEEMLSWARQLAEERLWALEDVRSVSRGLERFLVQCGERVVRVPPKVMAGARRQVRSFGKSDSIDALAIARAAVSHRDLPLAVEDQPAREIKLLVDYRETLVRQRTEAQDRLRWLLHSIDPEMTVPVGALDRKVWLDRVRRRLARPGSSVEARIALDLVTRCRALTADANELEREIATRVAAYAPQLLDLKGCGALIAGKLIGETAGIGRFRTDAQLARLAGVAPLDASSGQQRRHASTATETANSTPPCTSSRSCKAVGIRVPAPTSRDVRPRARPALRRSAASSVSLRGSCSGSCARQRWPVRNG